MNSKELSVAVSARARGRPPNELTYGREVRPPYVVEMECESTVRDYIDWLPRLQESLREARQSILGAKQKAKIQYDKGRSKTPDWKEGEQVLVNARPTSSKATATFAKWSPRREGPYVLKKKLSPVTWLLEKPTGG